MQSHVPLQWKEVYRDFSSFPYNNHLKEVTLYTRSLPFAPWGSLLTLLHLEEEGRRAMREGAEEEVEKEGPEKDPPTFKDKVMSHGTRVNF